MHATRTSSFGRDSIAGRGTDYLTFYISSFFWLLRHAKRRDVLVACTDPPMLSLLALIIFRIKGTQFVNWIQDLYPEVAIQLGVNVPDVITTTLTRMRGASLGAATTNIAIGRCMRDRLISLGVPEDRIAVVQNWADDEAIRPVPRNSEVLRMEWDLDRAFVVAYSGNLGRSHEVGTLIELAKELRNDDRIKLLFIGGGSGLDRLCSRVREDGLCNVVFKPYQPRALLRRSLAVADIHLVSLRETLNGLIVPSKFYGIAAAGRSTIFIGPDACEVALVLREEECGAVFKSGEAARIAAYIRRLSDNPTLLDEQGRRARKCIEARYTLRRAVRDWREILTQTHGHHRRLRPSSDK